MTPQAIMLQSLSTKPCDPSLSLPPSEQPKPWLQHDYHERVCLEIQIIWLPWQMCELDYNPYRPLPRRMAPSVALRKLPGPLVARLDSFEQILKFRGGLEVYL